MSLHSESQIQNELITQSEHERVEPAQMLDAGPMSNEQGAAAPKEQTRKSSRERRLTPKMLELTEQQTAQREKKESIRELEGPRQKYPCESEM